MKAPSLFICAALILVCHAEDFTLADGTVLTEARVVRQDDESATIAHKTGVQRIPYNRLSTELQEKLKLTPADVQARRDKAREAARLQAEAQEKKRAQQRAALEASGLSPRYMTGADVISLYSSYSTLSAAMAEYLAAEWNRREALRCGLTVEAQRYKEDATVLEKSIENERAAESRTKERLAALEAKYEATKAELQRAQLTIQSLEKQNKELRGKAESSSSTTIVVTEPRVIPVYQPPVVIPPVRPPVQPRPPVQVRPAQRMMPTPKR